MFTIRMTLPVVLALAMMLAAAPSTARPAKPDVYDGKKISQPRVAWQVVIYQTLRGPRQGLLCGGTVIAPHWILTAAHCFRSIGGARIPDGLLAISHGSTTLAPGRDRVQIGKVIEHPSYQFGRWDNDIALVYTPTAMTVTPIVLATEQQRVPGPLRVVGWGETETGPVSADLLYADIPPRSQDVCEKIPAYNGRLTERLMCAGNSGADSCHGDSGGPLYGSLDGGRALQFGITIAGEGCGDVPGVYVKVAAYRAWIEQVMAPAAARLEAAPPGTEMAAACGDRTDAC